MNLAQEYIELVQQIAEHVALPDVTRIHLPRPQQDPVKADEFGFVFLQDGSAGPFYTSLEDSLMQLWQLYPDGKSCQANALELINHLDSGSLALSALALGVYNAISQSVMSRAGYTPGKTSASRNNRKPQSGQTVAMVGYFRPLIERYLEQGINLLVLEKNPARVEVQPGVQLTENPVDLLGYEFILCTASSLINGSLPEILKYKKPSAHLSLIGPSGSGLPDILFSHGVNDVGGFRMLDPVALHRALDEQVSWGHAGVKYQIDEQDYAGIKVLIKSILHKEKE